MNSTQLDERLIALESRLAHFERMTEDLSDVMADQARTIDLLTAQLRQMKARMMDLMAGREDSPQDDRPPPHY